MPKCFKCGQIKPESLFYKYPNGKLRRPCKGCAKQYQRLYDRKHRREQHKKYLRQNLETQKMWEVKHPEYKKIQNIAQKYPKLKQCEFCPRTKKLERHHPDYDYPDIFATCCRECHIWIRADVRGDTIRLGTKWVFRKGVSSTEF